MNLKLTACASVLLLIYARPICAQDQSTGSRSQPQTYRAPSGCKNVSGKPCEALRLPEEIANTPARRVSNREGDLWAVNRGYEIDISWTPELTESEHLLIYRGSSPKGPWSKIAELDQRSFPSTQIPFRDVVASIERGWFYRIQLRRSGKLVKTYGVLRVPKYGMP
jgi:hypothetical protein